MCTRALCVTKNSLMIEEILNYCILNVDNKSKFCLVKEKLVEFCVKEKDIFHLYRTLKMLELDLNELSNSQVEEGLIKKILSLIKIELDIITMKIEILKKLDDCYETVETDSHPAKLKWTDSKIDLVELIYAIKGSVKDGKESVKNIVVWFEYMFQIKLGNVYDIIQEISIRKKERTKYIPKIKERFCELLDKMDS